MLKRGVAVRLSAAVLLLALAAGLSGCLGLFGLCSLRFVSRVLTCGYNQHLDMGLPGGIYYLPTEHTTIPNGAVAAATGANHSIVLLTTGELYGWGASGRGQLGVGDDRRVNPPDKVLLGLPAPVRRVAAGEFHTLAILNTGDVYVCGFNDHGQLGVGDKENRFSPTKINGLPGPAAAAAGGAEHSLVVLEDGEVYSFGYSGYQLGLGENVGDDVLTPRRVTGFPSRAIAATASAVHSLVLLENGDVYGFGWAIVGESHNAAVPTRISLPGRATAVAAGHGHFLFLLENGDVYACGDNFYGQLGLGDTDDRYVPTRIDALPGRAVAIGCGYSHSFVLLENGALYGFGDNRYGTLGLGEGSDPDVLVPTQVTALPAGEILAAVGGYRKSVFIVRERIVE